MNAKSDSGRKIRKMFYYINALREEIEKCEEKDKLIENLKTSEESYKVKYLNEVEAKKKCEIVIYRQEETIKNLSRPKTLYNPDPITSKFAMHLYELFCESCSVKELYWFFIRIRRF